MSIPEIRRIAGYRYEEGPAKVVPQEGEEFWLFPNGYYGEDSLAFINILKDNMVIQRVDVCNLSEVYKE